MGVKPAFLKVLETDGNLLVDFAREDLNNDDSIMNAEQFLMILIVAASDCFTLDYLRVKMYHYNRDKKFITFPCTSVNILQNIEQARIGIQSPCGNVIRLEKSSIQKIAVLTAV